MITTSDLAPDPVSNDVDPSVSLVTITSDLVPDPDLDPEASDSVSNDALNTSDLEPDPNNTTHDDDYDDGYDNSL